MSNVLAMPGMVMVVHECLACGRMLELTQAQEALLAAPGQGSIPRDWIGATCVCGGDIVSYDVEEI